MKITKFMRFLLIAIAAVMVFSLFACGETPEETESTSEDVVEPVESSDTKPQDSEEVEPPVNNTESSENQGGEATEPRETDTTESDEAATTESESAESAETTETETETEKPECPHTELTEVAAKAATCTEAGNEAYKICSCGAMFDAEGNAIDAIPVKELDPEAHEKVNKAFIAPTTAEAGYEAHVACKLCGKLWDAEGTAIDAVPTIPVIVPQSEIYLGAAELSAIAVQGGPVDDAGTPSKFKTPVMSADRTYVRFERDGKSTDGAIYFLGSNTKVTGQYMIVKYRTNNQTVAQVWANTTENGHSSGASQYAQSLIADDEWHILIVDLSSTLETYVKPDDNGKFTIQWARMDIFDELKETGYFDIAFVIYCDDPAEVEFALLDGDKDICPHIAAPDCTYTDDGATHFTDCMLCGGKLVEDHVPASVAWDAEKKLYVGECFCGGNYTNEMLYVSEAATAGMNNYMSPTQMDGFVRYTFVNNGKENDPYAHIYVNGNTVTGQYIVIKYRMVNNGTNPTNRGFYAATKPSGHVAAAGGDDKTNKSTFVADGEWRCTIVSFMDDHPAFIANEDKTYTVSYLRVGFNPAALDGSCYIDIDEIAFADNIAAAEQYVVKHGIAPYVSNLDESNCSLNGDEKLTGSIRGNNTPIVLDLTDKVLKTADAISCGGWTVTPGGIAAYKFRVVKVDGAVVENPVLVDWAQAHDVAEEDGIVTTVGIPSGWSVDCRYGTRVNKTAIDLSDYLGKTVDVEIVAIAKYGAEIIHTRLINVAVPEVKAESTVKSVSHVSGIYKADGEYLRLTTVDGVKPPVEMVVTGGISVINVKDQIGQSVVQADGTVKIWHWTAVDGAYTTTAYRVIDENGEVITDWTDAKCSSYKFGTDLADAEVIAGTAGNYIPTVTKEVVGKGDSAANVSAAAGKTVTVEFAAVMEGDVYVIFCKLTNIEVPQA